MYSIVRLFDFSIIRAIEQSKNRTVIIKMDQPRTMVGQILQETYRQLRF